MCIRDRALGGARGPRRRGRAVVGVAAGRVGPARPHRGAPGRPTAGADGDAPPVPADRLSLVDVSVGDAARRHPRRRHGPGQDLSLIHISEPTRLLSISYAVFCLKKKKPPHTNSISTPFPLKPKKKSYHQTTEIK